MKHKPDEYLKRLMNGSREQHRPVDLERAHVYYCPEDNEIRIVEPVNWCEYCPHESLDVCKYEDSPLAYQYFYIGEL